MARQGNRAARPEVGQVVANRYRVERLLGEGGMGAVFEARNLVTDKRVAIKWMLGDRNAATLERLIREARAAGRVHHPNIVDVYDVGEHEGSLFLVMELLRGQSLDSLLKSGGAQPVGQVLCTLLPAMRGVEAAHRMGVIHRDLKPANVFLCCDDTGRPLGAKVLDFGVSKIVSQDQAEATLTHSGAILGTPAYMAPEQLDETRTVDDRADVYAFGVILYHALAGRRPFETGGYSSLVLQVNSAEPPWLSDIAEQIPKGLASAVHRALVKDKDERFATMGELIQAVERFAGEQPLSVAPSAPQVPASADSRGATPAALPLAQPSRRPLWAALLGALVLVAVVGVVGWLWSRGGDVGPGPIATEVSEQGTAVEAPSESPIAERPRAEPAAGPPAAEPAATPVEPLQPTADRRAPSARRARRKAAKGRSPEPAPNIIELSREEF